MEEIAEVGEKDRRVVWIEDRDARLDAVKPGTGGKLAFQAVGVAIDVEGSFAGRRLVAKIADEDRPVVKTAVGLVVQGQLDVADAVAVHILGQLRIGIDLRNDERDSIVPVDVWNLDFGLQAVRWEERRVGKECVSKG